MKILRLHRVEYLVKDVDAAEKSFRKLLNTDFVDHREFTRPFGSLSLMNNDVGTELVGTTPDGPLAPVLEQNGEGILTIVYEVEDINETRTYLNAQGFPIINDAKLPSANGKIYNQISLAPIPESANICLTYLQITDD